MSTLDKVNAIIYVIDAAPAQNGGFIFRNDYKKHILSLGQSLDKIFLVFNKADTLSTENLNLLKERVIKDLKKLNLFEKVSEKIYYTTTLAKEGNSQIDAIEKLENDLWNFIINENRYGIVRLALINKGISNSITSCSDILKVRLLNAEKHHELQKAIADTKLKVPELIRYLQKELFDLEKSIERLLVFNKHESFVSLEEWLKSFKHNENLPEAKEIKKFLKNNLNSAVTTANKEHSYSMYNLKNYIDNWIEEHLKQVRTILSSTLKQRSLDLSEIEKFEFPSIDLASSWGMGVLGYVAGFILNPAIAITAGIIGFLGNLLLSAESRRAKRIVKIVEESRKRYNKSFDDVILIYKEAIAEHSTIINNYVVNKLNLYFNDLSSQMGKLDEKLSANELNQYNSVLDDLSRLQKEL